MPMHHEAHRPDGGGDAIDEATDIVLVYTTWPDEITAREAASLLLEARLVACANILPGMLALYRWQGAIETDREVVMILKTTRARTEALADAVRARHPYEVPALVVLPAAGVLDAYGAWLRGEVSA